MSPQNANGTTRLRSPLSSARANSLVKASNDAHYGRPATLTVIESAAVAFMLNDDGGLEPGPCFLPELSCELRGGGAGHFQRNFDDCLRAAVATVTQIDYEQVQIPAEPVIVAHVLPYFAVAHGLGMEAVDLQNPPEAPWLAISDPIVDGGERFTHCFAYQGSELLFDPFGFIRPDGRLLRDELPVPAIAEGVLFFPESSPD